MWTAGRLPSELQGGGAADREREGRRLRQGHPAHRRRRGHCGATAADRNGRGQSSALHTHGLHHGERHSSTLNFSFRFYFPILRG